MARRTKEDSLQTREKLLDAAERVFLHKNVAAASLDEIAGEAGLTRGALYHHFASKSDILDALHERVCLPFDASLSDILASKTPAEDLKSFYIEIVRNLEANQRACNLVTILMLKTAQGECSSNCAAASLEKLRESKAQMQKKLVAIFKRLQKEGQLNSKISPATATQCLKAYLSGIFWEYLQNPASYNLKKQAPEIMEAFFSGIVKS